jgi:replication initiation factor
MELGAVVDAGIDYLSMTMKNDNPRSQAWLTAAHAYLSEIAGSSSEIVASRRLGYDGFSFGGSFVGGRAGDTIAVYSGERAKRAYTLLYRSDLHISRIDVQVSYRYTTTTNNVAQVVQTQVDRDNRTISTARQRNATLIADLRGGSTCYVGQQVSEQYARIYNKDAESGEERYKNVWRFEVQLKNRLATKVAEQFAQAQTPHDRFATTFVKHWLRHRGVTTPWKADAELFPLPSSVKERTPNEKKLEWLKDTVRPTIRSLLKYGLRDDILAALGLDDRD